MGLPPSTSSLMPTHQSPESRALGMAFTAGCGAADTLDCVCDDSGSSGAVRYSLPGQTPPCIILRDAPRRPKLHVVSASHEGRERKARRVVDCRRNPRAGGFERRPIPIATHGGPDREARSRENPATLAPPQKKRQRNLSPPPAASSTDGSCGRFTSSKTPRPQPVRSSRLMPSRRTFLYR